MLPQLHAVHAQRSWAHLCLEPPPLPPTRRAASQECEALKAVSLNNWASRVIYTTWDVEAGPPGLRAALDTICGEAEAAVDAGAAFLVLSDRTFGPTRCAVPPLLAVGAVHHRLVDAKKRSRVGLIVETGEVRAGCGGRGGGVRRRACF